MLESQIVNKIIKYINHSAKIKGFAWKNHGGLYGTKGLPDIMAVIRKGEKSFFICLEVKTETGVVTEIQKKIIKRFTDLNIMAGVVRSLDEVKELIENLKEEEFYDD